MFGGSPQNRVSRVRAFLSALARDTHANTLAIMAIALIPLAGLVGGGVDISRMYIVKTRLQHACDAGALAGRKAMGAGTWANDNYAARTTARQFFDANFKSGSYGTSNGTREYTESGGKVTGTASADVPMTLMRIFAQPAQTLTVTCDAEMRLPNTDVMFVLDTTGSMDDPIPGDSESKITGLRRAVKCFYEVVAKQDIASADCGGTAPSGGIGNAVQIRFGFVPYATNVNIGKQLPTDFFANSWSYQTRTPLFRDQTSYGPPYTSGTPSQTGSSKQVTSTGSWAKTSNVNASYLSCVYASDPADSDDTLTGTESAPYNVHSSGSGQTQTTTYNTSQPGWYYDWRYEWVSTGWFSGECQLQRRTVNYDLIRTYTRTDTGTETVTQVFDKWHYAYQAQDVSGLKNSDGTWNDSFELRIGDNYTMKTLNWNGCIEERPTVRATDYDPVPDAAYDLQINLKPDRTKPWTLWGPSLPGIIYMRNASSGSSSTSTANWTLAESDTTTNYRTNASASCPSEARKLSKDWTASTFNTYVNNLTTGGNTYHDIGLLWGARLLTPHGMFESENAQTPTGGSIVRHLIFMTDGEACTGVTNYAAYGLPWFDRRQTSASAVPTSGCVTDSNGGGTLTEQVLLRTQAICTAIKNEQITLWVIWFGAENDSVEDALRNCASDSRFFSARNSAQLQQTFSSIAGEISQLRLTR